ncbi:MAG: TIGR04219 family outer membrane beta-barrel protein [Aliarcobacter sp.]|nr:TIGR04219 family outer membrane beta-barrel protein [Aliarcobacter sp.]
MKKNILLSLIASLAINANADTLGLEVGAAYWNAQTSGNVEYKGSSIDLEKDLGYEDLNTNFIWASFEHPIPLIPNLKIQHTQIDDSSSKSANVTFDNKVYSGTVSSSIKLNQTDFILYYELLDNWVNLDLGINGKYFDGSIDISDSLSTTSSTKDLTYVVPMAYAKVKFDLPFSGLSVESDLSYISYSGSKSYDFKGGLNYLTSFGLGATAGYRTEKIQLDDVSNVYSDIEISGAYAGLYYHF